MLYIETQSSTEYSGGWGNTLHTVERYASQCENFARFCGLFLSSSLFDTSSSLVVMLTAALQEEGLGEVAPSKNGVQDTDGTKLFIESGRG